MNMEKFVIEGGYPLSGEMTPSGNKNEALPVLAATLLTDEVVHLKNLPRIRDVMVMCEVIESIGGTVEWVGLGSFIRAGQPDFRIVLRRLASPCIAPHDFFSSFF